MKRGSRVEAHGGYLCRLESVHSVDWVRLGQEALATEGKDPDGVSLQFSAIPRRKVLRIAYDAPFSYGTLGTRWYEIHHAMAMQLSRQVPGTVHAYAIDPDALELVVGYGAGRRVGGERLVYADADLPDELFDEESFEKMRSRWPIGHLAYVFGVSRADLLALPRAPSVLLNLDGTETAEKLEDLLPRVGVRAARG